MNENYNNQTSHIPYMGGTPVRCPRCSNVVSNRYCNFCGLDLSTVYFKTQQQPNPPYQQSYQQPVQPPQPQYGHPYQQTVQQPQPPSGQLYGSQQPYMYNYQQTRRKNNGWVIGVIIVAVALCLYLFVRLSAYAFGYLTGSNDNQKYAKESFSPPYTQEEFHFAGGVSHDEFKKLKNGMSYAQVSSIIGGDGEIVKSGETLKKETFYTYGWAGENNPSAIVYITITNDKVSDITLEGKL